MTLRNAPLSIKFTDAICQHTAFVGQADLVPLDDIAIVGPRTTELDAENLVDLPHDAINNGFVLHHDQRLNSSEEAYLIAGNWSLLKRGFKLASKPRIRVCDINLGSDFLEEPPKCELLVMSSLRYNPRDCRQHVWGRYSKQSRLADQPEKWVDAFSQSNAKAILIIWIAEHYEDYAIAHFVKQTNNYTSVFKVERDYLRDALLNGFYAHHVHNNKGAELFLRSDLV